MRNKLFFLLVAGLLMSQLSAAQQAPEFTQFMDNKMYYNPAYAGVEGITRLSLLIRSKWTGYTGSFDAGGAPTTQVLTMNAPIYKLNSGFGAFIMNDNLGGLNNLALQGSYAYHVAVKDAKLSFGINAGFYSQSIDFDRYRPNDGGDPLILEGKQTQFRPDMGAGVFYQAKKLYGSISVAHLLNPSFNFGSDQLRNSLEPTIYIMGGYHYDITYNLELTPSLLIQSDFNQYLINLGAVIKYNNKFWGGITYKYLESASLIVGMSLLKSNALDIGYGFDYIIHNQQAKQATSNEIRLSYALPINPFGSRKVVRTPRFRH
ncbi:MAG: type IX secretion system membrane protein PorP/SprF [Cyclobacteriaceae bacterium]|nr:type IX secretion system membrane protein PorP/SprF [Cyclobacteriaceae bacterium]